MNAPNNITKAEKPLSELAFLYFEHIKEVFDIQTLNSEFVKNDIKQEIKEKFIAADLKMSLIFYEPTNSMKCQISENGFIDLKFKHYSEVYIKYTDENNLYSFYPAKTTCCVQITITPDLKLFQKNEKTGKLYPLAINNLNNYSHNPFFVSFINDFLSFNKNETGFTKDIIREGLKNKFVLPVSFNEIFEYHNKQEFFLSKYKIAKDLKINFNKLSFNLGYLIIKAYPYVDEKSKGILQNLKNENLCENIYPSKIKEKVRDFLFNYYKNKFAHNLRFEEYQHEVSDYIYMAMNTKQKVSLTFNSIKKIIDAHDEILLTHIKPDKTLINIPKNSVFNELRKQLPSSFEWIKTRKRLIAEGKLCHHCVASSGYNKKINEDKSAIYSFVDKTGEYTTNEKKNQRYTIEFGYKPKNKKYFIKQIQGRCNRAETDKMYSYVNDLLENHKNQSKKEPHI